MQLRGLMIQVSRIQEIAKITNKIVLLTQKWDNELAYLAELNARSCLYGHDSCRATEKFTWAGQNIARRGNTKGYEKLSISIKYMITDWFNEYQDANMGYIDSYQNHISG